jgi:RND family efflux transporter MFP subunit
VTFERYAAMKEKQAATVQQVDEAAAELRHAEAQEKLAEAARITSGAEVEMAQMKIGVARAELKAAEAEIAVREAAQRAAAARLAEATTMAGWLAVKAPFAGRVFKRHVHPGAFVHGGGSDPTPLFLLQATEQVRVAFEVPDAEARNVGPGNGVRITGRGIPGDPVQGKVTRSAGARSPGTRALPVEVHLSDDRIRPGMYVSVDLDLDTHQNAITVPVSAVVTEKGGASVFVVKDGKAEKVPVKLGVESPGYVEVLSGLTGDEDVIIRGRDRIRPGAGVSVVREKSGAKEKTGPGGEGR